MDAYSVDFEEGEIREYAPAPIFSSIAPRRCSRYYDRDDDDDESIRSSRPCTPPSQGMSVPGAPGPKPTLSRVVATTLPLPSPPPQGRRGGVSTTSSSAAVAGATLDGRDAARWTIPPDVYRKAESALARITSMSRGRSSAHSASDHGLSSAHSASDHGLSSAVGPPTGTHRYSPEQGALGPTTVGYGNSYSYASSASLENHREPPRSPLSPEELERAIGIIEELSIVDRVPPHVFIQCGVSPGTLYHAFNHLGLKLPDDLW